MEDKSKDIVSVRFKVILGFLLAITGFALYYSISRLALKDISDKIVQLSQPNEKLDILNGIFQDIIRIDQLQRQLAVLNQPKSRSVLFTKSEVLNQKLNDYRSLIAHDSVQMVKLDSLQTLLVNKDKLHISYLRTKSAFVNNKTFSARIDSLSNLVAGSVIDESSDKITLQKKTTTTKVVPSDTIRIERPPEAEKKPGFFQRLFSKKNDSIQENTFDDFVLMDKVIEEEFELQIDSLSRTFQDTVALQRIQEKMFQLKEEQIRKNQLLFDQELRYVNTGNELINYVFTILQDIEYSEMRMLEKESETAIMVATKSLTLNNILLFIFIASGSILVFLILTDISKARIYRSKLEEEKQRAEELSKVKERFLANISHELKTPLQSIIGYTELMEAEPTIENISVVKNSAEHLNYLVSDILDYSKIITDKFELSHRPFHLKSVLEYAYQSQLPLLEGKPVDYKFVYEFPHPNIIVWGDEYRLRQILINLLNNAIKFTQSGHVILEAKIVGEEPDCYSLEISVEDTGCGIDKNDQEIIFEYFEQIKDSRELIHQKGTGLGLAIVKQLISKMNASLTLYSDLDAGTRFCIAMNLPKGAPEDISPRAVKTIEIKNPASDLIPVIHVIDDEPYILELIKNIFEKNNIRGEFFSSADQFLNTCQSSNPTVVLTDLRMPGTDGIQLCKHLRAQDTSNSIYLIAMTAQVTSDQISELNEIGFNHILSKPFKRQELLSAIQKSCKISIKANNEVELEFKDDLQTDEDIEQLQTYIRENKTELLIDLLHKLASRVGFAGDEDLSILLRKYELDIRNNPTSEQLRKSLLEALKEYKSEAPSV